MTDTGDSPDPPGWVPATHRAIVDAGIRVVGYVPDGGLEGLLPLLDAEPDIALVSLATEEDGVALAAGAWLGGSRAALLMQSSGVGNTINMLSLLTTCEIPALLFVTMRGQANESNPWQVPMGRAAPDVLAAMGVDVRHARESDAVAATVSRACADAFDGGSTAAVLVDQDVIGAKRFVGDAGDAAGGAA